MGGWNDRTTGLPLLENFSAKGFASGEITLTTLEDNFGRLFVGGSGLQVFDGESWRTFPMGNSYLLGALASGEDGRLWAGAVNEVGFFEEPEPGVFKYHSLMSHLPKEHQTLGTAWGCAVLGRVVYFIYRDKVLRWDGTAMQVETFPGASRLFSIKLGDEHWFHHLETGLYRLTNSGPRLEEAAASLPSTGILGLARDADGLLVASGLGIFRPGHPASEVSDSNLSQYITEHRLTSFTPLPDGNYALATLTGGLIIVTPTGMTLRMLGLADGLPNRAVNTMRVDSSGRVWCPTPTGLFNFEGSGRSTVFNPLNGLKGEIVSLARLPEGRLLALTQQGAFRLEETPADGGNFQPVPELTATYNHLLPVPGGWLLSRHGGIDFYDGATLRTILSLTGNGIYRIMPARTIAKTYYCTEGRGLSVLAEQADGTFAFNLLAQPPDYIFTLHEDTTGRIWLGTFSKGAFLYDPATQKLSPLHDPATGEPLSGRVFIMPVPQGLLLFTQNKVFQAKADGSGLKTLPGAPALDLYTAQPAAAKGEILIAFQRDAANPLSQALGVLTLGDGGQTKWRELEAPGLDTVGSVKTMAFIRENNRDVLWVGGSAGALRLDYDTLTTVQKPSPPFIRLNRQAPGAIADDSGFAFRFHNHRLRFHVFTGEYSRSKDWLVQTRLGDGAGEWSALATRRSFEFSNLSEGSYRFEVRSVNPAGLASEPAVFTFRIMPPWYRSPWALAGYFMIVGVAVVVVIRVRERRIRARNEELEGLVMVRTAELVKANAAKDEFLASISHEIRNPMNGVIGIADNFRTDTLDPEGRRKFGLLRQCATHLSSLLEDILDFSKVQAGAVEIEARPFNLPALMDSISAMTAADSEKRGIPVEIAVSPAVPPDLVGDPKRIRQILLNLVSNALKFSGRGQVSVTVWCNSLSQASTEVIFAVSDEGPGISPEEQKRLFTRFERGAAAQQGRVPGTGLGLALCKGLAEKMGGRLWLESEPGQGSCFSFSAMFTLTDAPAAAAPASLAPAPHAHGAKTALVVDDQEFNRVVLTDLLETLGFTVHNAGDGTAGLTLAGSHDFDVVFLDYNLPGLSGLDVSRGIRALPNQSARAVIMATTAFNTPEKRQQCSDAGMDAFLGKPVTMERLRTALAAAMPAGPAPAAPRPAADGLANLRLLAKKKGAPFAGELALFLSELEVELDLLHTAVQTEDVAATAHCAHRLYGRCAFIGEQELEQNLRKIEAESAIGQWAGVRQRLAVLATQVAGLRVRLASAGPVAPRA